MRVRNYIIDNRELFIDYLEKELCQNDISYVRIDNEIHFLDQIIRFYDIVFDKNEIITWAFIKIELEKAKEFEKKIEDIFSIPDPREFASPQNLKINKSIFSEDNYPVRNKFIQKYESNEVNQKLKRYSK